MIIALIDLGDLSRINPFFRDLDKNFRYEFLETIPFYLPYRVLEAIGMVLDEDARHTYAHIPPEYTITVTSWRVLKLIQGNSG